MALEASFALLGLDATITMDAGPAVPIKVLPDRGDVDLSIPGVPVATPAGQFELLKSQVPNNPKGGRLFLESTGETWRIKSVTSRDSGRHKWAVACEAVR
jgi:hypothetical protein